MDREGNCEFLHSFRNQQKIRYLHFLLRFGVALDVDVVNLLILQDEGEGAAESLGPATDLRIKLVRLKRDANKTQNKIILFDVPYFSSNKLTNPKVLP